MQITCTDRYIFRRNGVCSRSSRRRACQRRTRNPNCTASNLLEPLPTPAPLIPTATCGLLTRTKVYEYAAGILGTNTATAVMVMPPLITGGALDGDFDPRGNLWVSATGSILCLEGMVYEYAVNTLGTTNPPGSLGGWHEFQSGMHRNDGPYPGSEVLEELRRNNSYVITWRPCVSALGFTWQENCCGTTCQRLPRRVQHKWQGL